MIDVDALFDFRRVCEFPDKANQIPPFFQFDTKPELNWRLGCSDKRGVHGYDGV